MKIIPLTQEMFAKVDDADFEKVNQYKWYAKKAAYLWYAARGVRTNGQTKTIYMHRFIMNTPAGMEVDHGKGGTLDNRRANIENCTKQMNLSRQKWRRQNENN